MEEVLNTLEAFHARSVSIFERLDDAVSRETDRLASLEDRIANATARLESSRAGTQALKVRSARRFSTKRLGSHVSLQSSGRILEAGTLARLPAAVSLPEDTAHALSSAPPTPQAAASDISRVFREVVHAHDTGRATGASSARLDDADRLLMPQNRLHSTSDMLLFNSDARPYENTKQFLEAKNLVAPQDEAVRGYRDGGAVQRMRGYRDGGYGAPPPNLMESEPDWAIEVLDFKPRKADEVLFDLPALLPHLGPVADNIAWQSSADSETAAWEMPARGRQSMAGEGRKSSRQSMPGLPADYSPLTGLIGPADGFLPPGRAAPPQQSTATPIAAKAIPKAPATAKVPPPPPASQKGKGKGKGPPPPRRNADRPKPPPPAPRAAASSDMGEVFTALNKANPLAGLRKSVTRESTGTVGKVVN